MSKKEKEYIKMLEQQNNYYKLTLDFYSSENQSLKLKLEDMKETVKVNKEQLNEYITTITNKDLVVEKMNNTITQLKSRLEGLEMNYKACLQLKNQNSGNINNTNNLYSNNITKNNNLTHITSMPNNEAYSHRVIQNTNVLNKVEEGFVDVNNKFKKNTTEKISNATTDNTKMNNQNEKETNDNYSPNTNKINVDKIKFSINIKNTQNDKNNYTYNKSTSPKEIYHNNSLKTNLQDVDSLVNLENIKNLKIGYEVSLI